MEEKEQEKKEQVLKFVGSAYQNNSLNKDGEIVKLNTPFYNVTIDKDALKGLKSDNKGMLYFAVHQRQDLEPDSKKPNCFIIEKNKNIIDIDSVKDFSVKKSEIMGLPTKDFTNADGTVKQSICLLITTDGVIKLNNKALGLEGVSPILEGKAYEINTLLRKAELVKKIENTETANNPKYAAVIKEMKNIPDYVGGGYEKQSGENKFCHITLNRNDLSNLPSDNYGNVKLDVVARKELGKDGSSHFVIPSTSTYKGYNNINADYEVKFKKEDILNPKLIQTDTFKKDGADVKIDKVHITINSNGKVTLNKGLYENKGVDVSAVQFEGKANLVDKEARQKAYQNAKEAINAKAETKADTKKADTKEEKTTKKSKGAKL